MSNYAVEMCPSSVPMEEIRPSMTERLKRKREYLLAELARLDEAISAIEANPGTQTVLDALAKLGELRP